MKRLVSAMNRLADFLQPYSKQLGLATLVMSLIATVVGLGHQVWINYVQQNCGISLVTSVLFVLMLVTRLAGAISARAWWFVPSAFVGVLICITLVVQWIIY